AFRISRLSSVNSTPTTITTTPNRTWAVNLGRNAGESGRISMSSISSIPRDCAGHARPAKNNHDPGQNDEQRRGRRIRKAEQVELRNHHPRTDSDQPETARRIPSPAVRGEIVATDVAHERSALDQDGRAQGDEHERRDQLTPADR